jgi:peptidoglycan/LPS O-acetylase OafA/YrhL
MAQDFRNDIEGLRALAVLPILVFHLESTLCPGGFVGVDIFFVISGYLITRMILAQGERFRFREFYVRRFFRLFPALIVVVAATMCAGWRWLDPQSYAALARSAVAAIFGLSNVYFLTAVDYFNASSLSHPLLHTWSLGVEEQFYLVWPALLVAASSKRTGIAAIVVGTALVSMLCLSFLQHAAPQSNFYLMPARMFEFAAGALVLLAEQRFSSVPRMFRDTLGTVGAVLLGLALFRLDGQTPWPGGWTLLPVGATALLIFAGSDGFWRAALSMRWLRLIGKASYSIYLVHWPIITIFRASLIVEPSALQLAALGVASLVVGAALYALVELPFRQSGGALTFSLPRRTALRSTVSALIVTVMGAGTVAAMQGLPHRMKSVRMESDGNALTFGGDLCDAKRGRCVFGDGTSAEIVYLMGDSYATHLVYGLDRLFKELNVKGIALYGHGCLHVYGGTRFERGVANRTCRARIAEAYDFLATNRRPIIFAWGQPRPRRNRVRPRMNIMPGCNRSLQRDWPSSEHRSGMSPSSSRRTQLVSTFRNARPS